MHDSIQVILDDDDEVQQLLEVTEIDVIDEADDNDSLLIYHEHLMYIDHDDEVLELVDDEALDDEDELEAIITVMQQIIDEVEVLILHVDENDANELFILDIRVIEVAELLTQPEVQNIHVDHILFIDLHQIEHFVHLYSNDKKD